MANVIKPESHNFSDISAAILPFNVLADSYGEALAAEQLMLEHESYQLGEARFIKAMERQVERGEVSDNAVAKPLLDTLIPALAARITEFVEMKQRGKPHVSKGYFAMIKPESAAFIIVKTTLNILAKEESVPVQRVAMAIGGNIEDEIRFGRIRDEEIKHFKERVKPNLDKRNGFIYKKAYMEAVEAGMQDKGELNSTHEAWEKDVKFHVGIRAIEMLIEATGMVQLERKFKGIPDKDHEALHLAPEYVEKLTNRAHALAGISPMYQPMIVKPKRWTGVQGGGYWAKGRRPLNLIRVGSKRALDRYRQVDMPEVYDAINTIQETAWRINKDVLAVVNNVVTWANCPVEDVPSIDKLALPEKPEDIDNNEESLKKWKKAAAAIYRKEKARQSRRISLEFALSQANKFSKYNEIYFPYNMDWRGRVYAIPMFNPQGNDMVKGLLTFAKKVPVGIDGGYWLAVHGANCAGVDKVSLEDRVKWVNDNEANIIASAEAPLDFTWWAEQDSPFCFLAFCFEWAAYVKAGKKPSFESSLPLAFDGTCSGLQHFSAMLRDEIGGAAVNLLPADKPQDIYGIVAVKVNEVLRDLVISGTEDEMQTLEDKKTGEITERLVLGTRTLAAQWLEYGVTRSVTKRSVMTLAYGSKEYGFADQVFEDTVMPAIDNGKGAMFTEPSQACRFMAKLIWDAVSKTVVAAVEAMQWLQSAAKLVSSEVKDKKSGEILKHAMPVHWTTPNGFPVWSEYCKQEQKRIDCVILGTHRMALTINIRDKKEIDAAKQTSGIAPNFVHSMDASHLQMTVNKCFKVYGIHSFAMIHDSFGCHAGFASKMFRAVRETMVETYEEHDVIQEFYNQFEQQLHESQIEKMPVLPRKGNLELREILKSLYTFS
ncbi:DNA-directed RNA polymerase [Vibrio phage JSF11]|uniref:DNA-directed RNA polymerase n=2 Tax=Chatterjeevirus ICP3 TaxID=2733612 RepID=A0A2D0Z112_9CAUD|nr:N4-like RNA polymerase [Vibrio phage ICP3]ADX87446.1 RNA polymerase [Vibrio phage ICP3]ASV42767.1 DNA-directed RNA polymerase [Vibrio phage JSF11]